MARENRPCSPPLRAGGPLDAAVAALPALPALPEVGLLGSLALFFTPGALFCVYCFIRGKGDFSDGFAASLTDISQGYLQPNTGGENIPVSNGELSDLTGDAPLFTFLYKWFLEFGGVYKLAFGPKAFIVVSDPLVVRHLLKDNAMGYDKGVLAEILEPIMGEGLIPAGLEVWKKRRRAVSPGFHREYINRMTEMFAECANRSVAELELAIREEDGGERDGATVQNMEKTFLNVALDIIGLAVFNYDFGSFTEESPVIEAVYGVLQEAEHRSTTYIPYWDLPLASVLVPRQRAFRADMKVISKCLDDLILQATETRQETDVEALQNRDYGSVQDPSLLRFLVDARGEDATTKQLRDDLMTMLIAGHETTAAVLTWTLFQLMQNPEEMRKVVDEVEEVLGGRTASMQDCKELKRMQYALTESMRLYPQPPILIRRALADDTLPGGLEGDPGGYPIGKGTDLFISVWNLHRSPKLWDDPMEYRPDRWEKPVADRFQEKWKGYRPEENSGLYPNEVSTDYGFIPFGGGARKCIGDQFAFLEALVILSKMLQNFEFELAVPVEDVGMATGATIHTANGLMTRVRKRASSRRATEDGAVPQEIGSSSAA